MACRLSEKAIRRAIDRGQLKAFKLCSRLRISQEDMREWIASQRQPVLTREQTRPAGTTPGHRRCTGGTPSAGSFRAMIPDVNGRGEETA